MSPHDTFFLVYETTAIVSAISCIPVVLSYFLFKDIRSKLHFKLACTVSFCYMIAGFAASIGEPPSGSPLCEFQGLVQNYFNTAGVLWTTGIAYMLYLLVTTNAVGITYQSLSYFCWGAPLIAGLLPYISAYYGRSDGNTYGWCYLRLRQGVPEWHLVLWVWVTFYFWLFLSLAVMSVWTAVIYHRVVVVKSNLAPVVRMARKKLRPYPIALSICYAPIAALRIIATISDFNPEEVWIYYAVFIGNLSLGPVVSIIFFCTNSVIRELWADLIFGGVDSRSMSVEERRTPGLERLSELFGRLGSKISNLEMRAPTSSSRASNITDSNAGRKTNSSSKHSSASMCVTVLESDRPSFYGADVDGDLVEIAIDVDNRDSLQSQAADDDGFGYTGGWGRNRRDTETDDNQQHGVDIENPMNR
jgi:hypothetical protein